MKGTFITKGKKVYYQDPYGRILDEKYLNELFIALKKRRETESIINYCIPK